MIKLFGNISRKLLSEDKLNSWLFYVIGKIVLLFIGVLNTPQLNNWQFQTIDSHVEKNYKKEILENLDQEIYDLNKVNVLESIQILAYTQLFDPKNECFEEGQIVAKDTIYIFKAHLFGDNSMLPIIGSMAHTYVSPNASGIPSYGKHPRAFDEKGCFLVGPGRVNRDDVESENHVPRDPSKAKRKELLVCPTDKKRMMQEGPTEKRFNFLTLNCHSWAKCQNK